MLKEDRDRSGVHVVAGFGSAGKSEYIRHLLTRPGPFLDATPVYEGIFLSEQRDRLREGDVFHLDISHERRKGRFGRVPRNRFRFLPLGPMRYVPDIKNHPVAATGVFSGNVRSVDFLILPEQVLRARITQRTELSDDIHRPHQTGLYPSAAKLRVLDACPLADRYAVWMDYFEAIGAHVRFIHSGNRLYEEIAGRQAALDILNGDDCAFTSLVHEARAS